MPDTTEQGARPNSGIGSDVMKHNVDLLQDIFFNYQRFFIFYLLVWLREVGASDIQHFRHLYHIVISVMDLWNCLPPATGSYIL